MLEKGVVRHFAASLPDATKSYSTSETLFQSQGRRERAVAQLEIDAVASSGHEGSTLSLLNVRLMITDVTTCTKS